MKEVFLRIQKPTRTIRIPLIYGAFSILWIVITDRLAYFVAPNIASATSMAIAKGILFVLLSTLLIYFLLKADERNRASLQTELSLLQDSFSLLFEENPQPMWVDDPENLQLISVNQSALQLFGYQRAEFLNLLLGDLGVKEELPLLKEAIKHRKVGLQKTGPWRMVTHDGKLLYAYAMVVNIDYSGR